MGINNWSEQVFRKSLSGMRELNEKGEVLQTRSLEERKKGCFLSHFSDS